MRYYRRVTDELYRPKLLPTPTPNQTQYKSGFFNFFFITLLFLDQTRFVSPVVLACLRFSLPCTFLESLVLNYRIILHGCLPNGFPCVCVGIFFVLNTYFTVIVLIIEIERCLKIKFPHASFPD